jgi:uncharacterized protein (DUF4415 family)/uncharacterized DUF497 family protein
MQLRNGSALRWIWDPEKDRKNRMRHVLSFATAQLVFEDQLAVSRPDADAQEERWQTIGMIAGVIVWLSTLHRLRTRAVAKRQGALSVHVRQPPMSAKHTKKAPSKALTASQSREIAALAKLSEDEIDTGEIPEVRDWSDAERGRFYRPVKQQLTLRLDANVVAWFKRLAPRGGGYQTRINRALREYVSAREGARKRD